MKDKISPHEPGESLQSSVDEAFAEAEASRQRWEQWEKQNRLRSLRVQLPEMDFATLERLAAQQGTTPAQLLQNLVHGVMSTLKI